MQVMVVCPRCSSKFPLNVNAPQWRFEGPCPKCKRLFRCDFVTVRAKRSRVHRRAMSRTFHIRVIAAGGTEHLIEFVNKSDEDFELRNGDEAVFIYFRDRLHLILNLTIRRIYTLRNSKCFVASCVYGEESLEVTILRNFRDRCLLRFVPTALLVLGYTAVSPHLINWWGGSETFRRLSRKILQPVVALAARLELILREHRRQ
jgi:hypothetical protein